MYKILIADDSQFMVKVIEKLAHEAGFGDIDAVYCGTDALDHWLNLTPDITILDISMPGLTGEEVLAKIKAHNQNAKVIILTASCNPEIEAKCRQLGATDFIAKDHINDLVEVLLKALPSTERQCT